MINARNTLGTGRSGDRRSFVIALLLAVAAIALLVGTGWG